MNPKTEEAEMLKLRTEELILKTEELKQTSNSLLASNHALELKTEELTKIHAELFESNHQLASVNKELATTNKMFADTNKRFAQLNEELSATNKELARVNEELALANEKAKSKEVTTREFINIAAHELRTPAQSILGYAELANIDPELSKHDKQGILDAIYRNAKRLKKLTRDILDVTKIESNTLQLNKEVFNLNDVISNLVSDLKTQTINIPKGTVIVKYTPYRGGTKWINNDNNHNDNAFIIEADKERIAQVIDNILDNAFKFTKAKLKEGGVETIGVDAQKNDDQAIISIMDTGTGVDCGIMSRLFEKFATKSYQGTGLGLFISKSIVEAHGGRIWAQNNPNGRGATFVFSLPLSK
jgi:signal transduction histidine kinase